MATHFTKKELEKIVYLKDVEGKSHKEIAAELSRFDSKGEPATRSIMKQYKKAKVSGMTPLLPPPSTPSPTKQVVPEEGEEEHKGLNEMGRNERVTYLRNMIPASARGKFIYNEVLDANEKEMFEDEYFRIIIEEDSFTSAEEGILFMAILHWTMALRAMKRDKDSYNRSPQNGYTGANPVIYTDQWTREVDTNMKKYESMMKSLKLSREQRLKDIQRMGTTFLDYAERVAKTNEQEQIAEEILKLETASEEELKILQENGWLIGGGLPNNSACQYQAINEEKETEEDVAVQEEE